MYLFLCCFFLIVLVFTYADNEFEEFDMAGKKKTCFKDPVQLERPLVRTKYGLLQGFFLNALNDRLYSAFTSVPYAAPPIGNLRFEPPQPVNPWSGILNASQPTPVCIQYTLPLQKANLSDSTKYPFKKDYVIGVENCLFLNIFSPVLFFENEDVNRDICDNCGSNGCPVLVYIHGGAFRTGGAQPYGSKYLMQTGKIVLAVLNYRLGAMGYLSTEDEVVPGNNGLKDITYALKFIRENAQAFGGNPNSVTVVGTSSGAAIAQLLNISPLSRDLFQRIMCISGTFLNPWSFQKDAKQKAYTVAARLGCPTISSYQMVACLKGKDAADIVMTIQLFLPLFFPSWPFTVFGPVYKELPRKNAFLTKNPFETLLSGAFPSKPLIMTLVKDEGLFPTTSYIVNDDVMAEINSRWTEVAPFILDYNSSVAADRLDEVSQKIRKFYFGEEEISTQNADKLVKLIGDRHFNADVGRAALFHAYRGVFVSVFSYRGSHSFTELFSMTEQNFGVCHMDDVGYLFNTPFLNVE